MASPFSGLVLAAGVALTSPTLYEAVVVGTVPLEDALLRLVVVVTITTVAVTLVQWLFLGTSPVTETQLQAAQRLAELGSTGDAPTVARQNGPEDGPAG